MDFLGTFIFIGVAIIALAVTYQIGKSNGRCEGIDMTRDIADDEIENYEYVNLTTDEVINIINSVVVLPPALKEAIKNKLDNNI